VFAVVEEEKWIRFARSLRNHRSMPE